VNIVVTAGLGGGGEGGGWFWSGGFSRGGVVVALRVWVSFLGFGAGVVVRDAYFLSEFDRRIVGL